MSTKIIEQLWLNYKALVVPKDAGETQIVETRLAFYSGATALFSKMTGPLFVDSDGAEPTPEDYAIMALIQEEVDAFGQELDDRVLGHNRRSRQ